MTASREAKAKMSAQETTPGHSRSRADLILSMISNPRSVELGIAVFSVWLFAAVGFISKDASHPYKKSNKTNMVRKFF